MFFFNPEGVDPHPDIAFYALPNLNDEQAGLFLNRQMSNEDMDQWTKENGQKEVWTNGHVDIRTCDRPLRPPTVGVKPGISNWHRNL